MPTGQGAASKAAGKIETSSYGTSIALNGAGEKNQLHFISESLLPGNKFESSIHLDGSSGKKSLYNVLKKFSGDIQIELHYDGVLSLLACALGMSNKDVSPINAGSGAYTHYIEPSPDLSTRPFNFYEQKSLTGNAIRRMTIGFEKSVSIHENASCMVDGFTLDMKPDRTTANFTLIPYNQTLDSATNNASTNWDKPVASQVLWENAEVYLKPRDKFTIGTANKVIVINETADVSITVTEGTYTGGELAEEIASKCNASTLTGNYRCEFREETRRFHIYTIDSTSFKVVGAATASTMEDIIGFPDTTAVDTSQESSVDARPDAYTAFASGDKVGVSALNFSYKNGLSGEDQDSLSSNLIMEPERNELRTVNGTLEIPRYKDDTFLKAANYNTTYEMLLKFTGVLIGGTNYEEFNLFVPSIKFDKVGAPISGAAIIKQNLNFQAAAPDFLDFVNFFDASYFADSAFFSLGGSPTSAVGNYVDGLYLDSAANLKKFTKESGVVSISALAGSSYRMKQFQNDLYISEVAGKVEKYDGSAISLSCDFGAGDVTALEQFGDNLYALEKTTGKIFAFDGTTWSLSCDTTDTSAQDLISFGGYLWVYGSDGTNIDIQRYDGTTWATAGSNVTPDTFGSAGFTIQRGSLFFASGSKVFEWKGSAWVSVLTLSSGSISSIFSWKGELLIVVNDTDLHIVNLANGTSQLLETFLSSVTLPKAVFSDGNVFLSSDDSGIALRNIQEVFLKLQNQTATNPL